MERPKGFGAARMDSLRQQIEQARSLPFISNSHTRPAQYALWQLEDYHAELSREAMRVISVYRSMATDAVEKADYFAEQYYATFVEAMTELSDKLGLDLENRDGTS